MLETLFWATLVNADGRIVPVRLVGEKHVLEDLGRIPSFADWGRRIAPRGWMLKGDALDVLMPDAMASASVPQNPRRAVRR